MYSIYLGGYRKAVEDSMEPVRPKRLREAFEKIQNKRAKEAEASPK
jgi:hypothetical protein